MKHQAALFVKKAKCPDNFKREIAELVHEDMHASQGWCHTLLLRALVAPSLVCGQLMPLGVEPQVSDLPDPGGPRVHLYDQESTALL